MTVGMPLTRTFYATPPVCSVGVSVSEVAETRYRLQRVEGVVLRHLEEGHVHARNTYLPNCPYAKRKPQAAG